jgi:bromodomain-containing protein 7/9
MDDFDSFAADEDDASTSQSAVETRQNGHVPSGITLVLPSLKAIKAAKMGKKSKLKNLSSMQDAEVKKAPRPMKLKPLKEVLTKLIGQLKKKDDYAFFISPVDPSRVQGYAEMIKHPMDLGTMSTKVAKGKYRSLEEFTTDFRLVVTNAKIFNPPGSIYHTEADRLEVWGLDHIAKASAHVIEYETDWNIDVEQDEDAALNIDEDDDHVTASTPREIEGSQIAASPTPSSVPQQYIKRGPRGPYKKGTSVGVSEGIDAEGRLPGSKDGVGAFPPGSDWAEMMIALKIKGKRYRTKKERLRIEKEGLPHLHDGSLDYTEMEDPFSILNVLVPEPLSKPQLNPLYPSPQVNNTTQPLFPGPVNVPSTRPSPTLATLATSTSQSTSRRRHWTIVRNASSRAKLKEKEDEEPQSTEFVRDPFPSDFGSFAVLGAELGASACSEEKLATSIRASIENRPIKRSLKAGVDSEYWSDEKAEEAWDYIRDVVYGGVNGFAYVRSIAEFVRSPEEISHQTEHTHPLGTSVARYVEQRLVDVVTRGRHELLCTTAAYLHSILKEPLSPTMEAQMAASLTFRPTVFRLIQALQHEQLDMAALIRSPDELEKAGLGELGIPEGPAVLEEALECAVQALEELDRKVQLNDGVKVEDDVMDVDGAEEDPVAKKLRLTLLALAKRAPLDKIAPLPAALVPAHIRKIVPTI